MSGPSRLSYLPSLPLDSHCRSSHFHCPAFGFTNRAVIIVEAMAAFKKTEENRKRREKRKKAQAKGRKGGGGEKQAELASKKKPQEVDPVPENDPLPEPALEKAAAAEVPAVAASGELVLEEPMLALLRHVRAAGDAHRTSRLAAAALDEDDGLDVSPQLQCSSSSAYSSSPSSSLPCPRPRPRFPRCPPVALATCSASMPGCGTQRWCGAAPPTLTPHSTVETGD